MSSKIEGTIATMGEVLEYEAEGGNGDLPNERKEDFNEVLNYRKAMWHGIELLKDLPLCQRVIKGAHQVLLDGVRGQGKSPGNIAGRQIGLVPLGVQLKRHAMCRFRLIGYKEAWIFGKNTSMKKYQIKLFN